MNMNMSDLKETLINEEGIYPNSDGPSRHVFMEQPKNISIQVPQVGSKPCTTVCPACRSKVRTRVSYETGKKTHFFAMLGLSFFMCCGCCWPYKIDSFKNAEHSCPNCCYFLGVCDK